jgi:hypothetical protein
LPILPGRARNRDREVRRRAGRQQCAGPCRRPAQRRLARGKARASSHRNVAGRGPSPGQSIKRQRQSDHSSRQVWGTDTGLGAICTGRRTSSRREAGFPRRNTKGPPDRKRLVFPLQTLISNVPSPPKGNPAAAHAVRAPAPLLPRGRGGLVYGRRGDRAGLTGLGMGPPSEGWGGGPFVQIDASAGPRARRAGTRQAGTVLLIFSSPAAYHFASSTPCPTLCLYLRPAGDSAVSVWLFRTGPAGRLISRQRRARVVASRSLRSRARRGPARSTRCAVTSAVTAQMVPRLVTAAGRWRDVPQLCG